MRPRLPTPHCPRALQGFSPEELADWTKLPMEASDAALGRTWFSLPQTPRYLHLPRFTRGGLVRAACGAGNGNHHFVFWWGHTQRCSGTQESWRRRWCSGPYGMLSSQPGWPRAAQASCLCRPVQCAPKQAGADTLTVSWVGLKFCRTQWGTDLCHACLPAPHTMGPCSAGEGWRGDVQTDGSSGQGHPKRPVQLGCQLVLSAWSVSGAGRVCICSTGAVGF